MGQIHSKKTYSRNSGESITQYRGGLKVYNDDELYALNAYLRKRESLPDGRPCKVTPKHFICHDDEGIDWLARKDGAEFTKMFPLTTWRRFNWGDKPLNAHEHRYYQTPWAESSRKGRANAKQSSSK